MNISKRGEYAIKALIKLAIDHERGKAVTLINDIAEQQNIPQKYLEQILLNLKSSGILASKRGVGGGYTLNRAPENISLGEIISVVEGPLVSVDNVYGKDELSSVLSEVITQAGTLVKNMLDDISLRSMAQKALDSMEKNVPSYII